MTMCVVEKKPRQSGENTILLFPKAEKNQCILRFIIILECNLTKGRNRFFPHMIKNTSPTKRMFCKYLLLIDYIFLDKSDFHFVSYEEVVFLLVIDLEKMTNQINCIELRGA